MSRYRIAMKTGWEKDLVAQAELEGKGFYRRTERSRILQQRILGSQEDRHLLLSPHREKKKKEGKHKPQQSREKRCHCLSALPALGMAAASGSLQQVLFSSSVLFSAF